MQITLDAVYVILGILGALGTFIAFVWVTSSRTTDKYNKLQAEIAATTQRLIDIEAEQKNEDGLRRKIDDRLDNRLSSLDTRIQSVETKVVGFEARVDEKFISLKEGVDEKFTGLKESITDLKKSMISLAGSKS